MLDLSKIKRPHDPLNLKGRKRVRRVISTLLIGGSVLTLSAECSQAAPGQQSQANFITLSRRDTVNTFDVILAVSTVLFVTSGTTIAVPGDWNNAANTIEGIGGGGSGAASGGVGGGGGGGGAYAPLTNFSMSGTVNCQIGGTATDTWLNKTTNAAPSSTTDGLLAKAGASGTAGALGAGGAAASCVPSGLPSRSGGNGGGPGGLTSGGGGGGGAGGPNGAGEAAGTGGVDNGGRGDAGSGGSAGVGAGVTGLAGGNGAEWTSNPGGLTAGSGGGGGATGNSTGNSGNGGLYGGGGAGTGAGSVGVGAAGIIVLTYTPVSVQTPYNRWPQLAGLMAQRTILGINETKRRLLWSPSRGLSFS